MKLIFPEMVEMGSSCFDLLDNSEPHVNMVILYFLGHVLTVLLNPDKVNRVCSIWVTYFQKPFCRFCFHFCGGKSTRQFLSSFKWMTRLIIDLLQKRSSTGTLNKLQFQFNLLSEEFTFHSNTYLVS